MGNEDCAVVCNIQDKKCWLLPFRKFRLYSFLEHGEHGKKTREVKAVAKLGERRQGRGNQRGNKEGNKEIL